MFSIMLPLIRISDSTAPGRNSNVPLATLRFNNPVNLKRVIAIFELYTPTKAPVVP